MHLPQSRHVESLVVVGVLVAKEKAEEGERGRKGVIKAVGVLLAALLALGWAIGVPMAINPR